MTDGVGEKELHRLRTDEGLATARLQRGLQSWDSTTRYKALDVLLTRVEPQTLLSPLLTMVQDDDPRVRATSVDGLAMAMAAQATLSPQLLPLITQARQDRDPGVRAASFSGLATVTARQKPFRPQVLPLFQQGLQDRSACVRATAASSLEYLFALSVPTRHELNRLLPDLLVMATSDASAWARSHAVMSLGPASVNAAESVPVLVKLVQQEPDAGLRSVAVSGLGHYRAAEPAATQAILAAMNDPDERVRTAAVYSLLNVAPNPFRHRSQAQQLSNQGLQTAIWELKESAKDPYVNQQKKTAIPPILETLMAEQRARWLQER
ncbi:HEAT repeat domain-containing protein [Stenomitos frigidus AS-A4]|uniref:HEAT repeat domain-containing protein n=1 Tax=Stenomitos frigidus AS-A4 TaxID=2933935 RepID=A0ABV0KX22_9CYAN